MARCLVVDDNSAFAENLAEILSDWGEESVVATSGPSALDLLQAGGFYHLLVELRMPVMDGVQVIREARRIQPNIASVIISAYANDLDLQRARPEGCMAVFCKQPFPFKELKAVLMLN